VGDPIWKTKTKKASCVAQEEHSTAKRKKERKKKQPVFLMLKVYFHS
jgi:hypothetical protein